VTERSLFSPRDEPEEPAIDPSLSRFVRVAPERGIDGSAPGSRSRSGDGGPPGRAKGAKAPRAGVPGAGRDGSLTYLDPGLALAIGDRVEIPLGRTDQPASGIVVAAGGAELLEGFPASKVKRVVRRADGGLPPRLVELARWMASYYVCPLGMVLATMTPAAVKKGTGRKLEVRFTLGAPVPAASAPDAGPSTQPAAASPKLSKPARDALERLRSLDASAFPLTRTGLRTALGGKLRGCKDLLAAGLLEQIRVPVVRANAGAFSHDEGEPDTTLDRTDAASIAPTPEQARAIDGIAASLGSFSAHLLFGVTGSGKTEVYLRLIERVLARGQTAVVLVPEISLTPQASARFRARFAKAAGAAGGVAVLHSGLGASVRHHEWRRAALGEVALVVGARSAVFAPLSNVGLIVVDEEHDSSYKQDQLPRYHARDVAIRRAQLENCPVVLGSATPSLESWFNTIPRDGKKERFRLWELPHRVGGGAMPRVEVVDIVEERRARARTGEGSYSSLIGPRLGTALERTLREGGQAILLLNRRGFANFVGCSSRVCGWVLTCDDCDAAMVFHKSKKTERGGWVACHHCLARKVRPARCPVCNGAVVSLGMGTQRVEEELVSRFGEFGLRENDTLVRVDSDTMHSARDYFEVLTRFGRGQIKVMVGTQMIAKGLDFPNVRLVGVVMADTALNVPDFRAAERTFQLVSQVAGGGGGGEHPGLVIVQAMQPDAPAITLAARHDYRGFASRELGVRIGAGLPPSTRMARVVARDKDEGKARAAAEAIAAGLRVAGEAEGGVMKEGPSFNEEHRSRKADFGGTGEERRSHRADFDGTGTTKAEGVPAPRAGTPQIRVLGPAACPIARIAQHFRVAVDVIAPSAVVLNRLLTAVRDAGLVKSDAHTAVDVDPVALM
jgi:primosomal protein N' (replication factor Y)